MKANPSGLSPVNVKPLFPPLKMPLFLSKQTSSLFEHQGEMQAPFILYLSGANLMSCPCLLLKWSHLGSNCAACQFWERCAQNTADLTLTWKIAFVPWCWCGVCLLITLDSFKSFSECSCYVIVKQNRPSDQRWFQVCPSHVRTIPAHILELRSSTGSDSEFLPTQKSLLICHSGLIGLLQDPFTDTFYFVAEAVIDSIISRSKYYFKTQKATTREPPAGAVILLWLLMKRISPVALVSVFLPSSTTELLYYVLASYANYGKEFQVR